MSLAPLRQSLNPAFPDSSMTTQSRPGSPDQELSVQDMVEALPRAKKHFFFSLLPAAQAGWGGSALALRFPQSQAFLSRV